MFISLITLVVMLCFQEVVYFLMKGKLSVSLDYPPEKMIML